MCGIVGYVGPREVRPLLFAGLEKLEYRGYDSAGISVLNGDRIHLVRAQVASSEVAMGIHEHGQAPPSMLPCPGIPRADTLYSCAP